jgi:hypothetical protein
MPELSAADDQGMKTSITKVHAENKLLSWARAASELLSR